MKKTRWIAMAYDSALVIGGWAALVSTFGSDDRSWPLILALLLGQRGLGIAWQAREKLRELSAISVPAAAEEFVEAFMRSEIRARNDLLISTLVALMARSEHRDEIQQALREVADTLERQFAGNEQYLSTLTETLEMILEGSETASYSIKASKTAREIDLLALRAQLLKGVGRELIRLSPSIRAFPQTLEWIADEARETVRLSWQSRLTEADIDEELESWLRVIRSQSANW